MTEDEARKKKCPRLIFSSELNDGISHDFQECLGSECMMWEPDNAWVKDGRYCTKETEGAKPVGGGDCGFKVTIYE